MFKHTGIRRTHLHNVRLAVLLSLTAGFVNAEGFLAFAVLTTNVTGHAALFAEKLSGNEWQYSIVVAIWMLLFFVGACFSSIIIEITGKNQRFSNLIPIALEILILVAVGVTGHYYKNSLLAHQVFSGSLLFAMGMQNSLVSMISKSAVRTTHLTGAFTDLAIGMARLRFATTRTKPALRAQIRLHFFTISFFITGALLGTYAFRGFGFYSFFIPAVCLLYALLYDILRVNARIYYRNIKNIIRQVKWI